MKNIILYLNGNRGLYILESLLKNNYKKITVFSSKKNKIIKKFENTYNIKINVVRNINSVIHYKKIKNLNPYLSIVAGFSQIFSKKLILLPQYGTINLHAGPLPKYRGGSPLNWQIINGEKNIGISIIQMDENIDTGTILNKSFLEKLMIRH